MDAVTRLLERNLADDDLAAVALLDDVAAGPQDDLAAPGVVALDDAGPAVDRPAGREVGARDDLHQLRDADLGLIDETNQAVADFAQVVRRDFGRHADG